MNKDSVEETMRWILSLAWRILVVALGYMLASMAAGWLLGRNPEWVGVGISLLSGILIGTTLGPIVARMQGSRRHHFVVWGNVLFLNALSLEIEGAFFVPRSNPVVAMLVAWTAFLLFQSLVTAGLITLLFASSARPAGSILLRKRAWYSWVWRFALSALSYLVFYFIFGAANYALVTKPYYAAHVSGLAVPAPLTVLMVEMVRAPLIVLSIVPLILFWKARKPLLAVVCGIILFVLGGVVPLLLNTVLPDLLRLASVVEIFFQNFLTGVVAVALLAYAPTGNSPEGKQN